ncbi:ABC transporter permease [Fulvivirga sp. M361]|nr:ABC transporter permease [Fulvivirga sp. M361]
MLSQVYYLIKKEVTIEWRNRYAVNGILLYLISTIFICYLSFNVRANQLDPVTWNVLFWIIILFAAVNAVAKSFIQEKQGQFLYYYWVHDPVAVIVGKTAYNSLLMVLMGLIGLLGYVLVLGNPVKDMTLFVVNLLIASIGLSFTLTMTSAIASKARNSQTLMAVLGFPIILPILLMVIKISKNAMDGLEWSDSYDEMVILLAINAIAGALSYLLFPYLWRS